MDYDGGFEYSHIVNAEINEVKHIKVYPSKVKDFVTIEKSVSIRNDLNIIIQDMAGQPFYQFKMESTASKKEISVADLIPGVYIISVYNKETVENFKIVKM